MRTRHAVRRGAGRAPRGLRVGRGRARARYRVPPGALRRLGADRPAAAVGGQLGRARAAPARERGGLRAVGVAAEVARAPRPRALDALLHGLRGEAPEALLRALPEGRGHRLGFAAPRALASAARGWDLRRARRGRVADSAYGVDPLGARHRLVRRAPRGAPPHWRAA